MIGVWALLGAGFLWGLIGTSMRYSIREGVSAEDIAIYRTLLAAAGFFLLTAYQGAFVKNMRQISGKVWGVLAAFSIFGVVGLGYGSLRAVQTGGVGFASVFLYLAPLFVAIWSRILFRERLTWLKIFSLVLTVGGVALVGLLGGGEVRFSTEAILWGVLSAFSYSLFYVFGRTYYPRYAPALLNAIVFTLAAIPLAWLAYHQNGRIESDFNAIGWSGIAFSAIFSTLIAYSLYSVGIQRVLPTRAAILCSIEPVIALLSAYALWNERLSPAGYAGAALVLAGVSISVMAERGNPRSA